MIKVTESHYKDLPSLSIENETLRAEFILPGARMVSLLHKQLDHEFLFQQASQAYVRGHYDEAMVREQSAGYDDMFPTIDACYMEEFPWQGIRLPDHGEVWSLDWDVQKLADALSFSVHGVRLPYKLTRRVSLAAANRLRLAYILENLAPFEIQYLWSSHPMLRPQAGARILLPAECKAATVGLSHSGRLGAYGSRITWPQWTDRGKTYDLSLLRSGKEDDAEAYYFTQPLSQGWCGLEFPSPSCQLRLSFPTDRVPFLGVVVGEGLRDDPRFYALLEPCSAPLARLDFSRRYAPQSRLPARGTHEWYLDFEILSRLS
jgi:hypothetical protein